MKIFWSFVRKEFWHVWRDRRSLTILLGLPVAMMLIFGFALSNEVKNSRIIILDLAKDEASAGLIKRLEESQYFEPVGQIYSYTEIESNFRKGRAKMAIVFPSNFAKDLEHLHQAQVQLVGDATDPNNTNTIIQYASAIIGDYQREVLGEQEQPYRIEVESRMLYNPQLESSFIFVPGVMVLILMLLGTMMTSVSIVKEKEMGTMEVLLVSPMKPIMVIISKAVPYLVLCFIDVCIILFLAYVVLGMPMRGSLILLLSECLLFIFTTLSLGLLVSTRASNQQLAMFVSLVAFLMPALIFSGFMFPIENMPNLLQWISNIIPTRWFFNIVKNIMVKGLGFQYILKDTIILALMTLFFLAIALRNFKIRLE